MPDKKESDMMALFGSLAKDTRKQSPSTSGNGNSIPSKTEKDGKPCRVCDSFKSWRLHEAKSHAKGGSGSSKTMGSAAAAGSLAAATTSTSTLVGDECPPDSQVLGRATWTFLHTMAAYYPEKADANQQGLMKSLLTSFSHFYPCGRCASHLREEMSKNPPPVDTRNGLSLWMCQTHNKVNVMLGKDEFDCSKLDERWRDGPSDGRCSWAQDVEY
ncbi:Flavin-linked sulfhydryl oxidase of the mitochondrial IMS [Coemansia sp. RSA 1933]|nr:Flavin-linked sulfhydryl oxidase of the mitochondrial IMS [Coemansia sp. RSA 1933]